MSKKNWMIYGANGFTGEMIAREAVKKGGRPILAGRNREAVGAVASKLGLESRIFDLAHGGTIAKNLSDCALVLHCAGPFEKTCAPMADGAMAAGCHYLDITGETAVYEYLISQGEKAAAAGVMLLPGVGFDVVPTDCMAARLKKELPDADTLEMAFIGPNKAASGTIKTVLRQLPHGSLIRRNGRLEKIPQLSKKRTVRIEGKSYTLYAIPWGDLVTAFHGTGIPNIAVYALFPDSQVWGLKLAGPLTELLKNPRVLDAAEKLVERFVPDPEEKDLAGSRFYIWGEARNPSGRKVSAIFKIADTYTMTARASLLCVERVIEGRFKKGFQTPSLVFGSDFVLDVSGTEVLQA